MAIVKEQSADAYASSVAFGGSVKADSVVIVVGTGSSSMTSCAKSAGTATIGAVQAATERNAANAYLRMFYAPVTGAGTLTMALTGGGDVGISIIEASGLDLADLFEAENYTVTPPQNPSVTLSTTIAASLLIAGLVDESAGSGTVTAGDAPGAWTLFGNQSGHQHAAEYIILSSTITTGACNLKTTGTPGSTYSVYQVIAFNGVAAGGETYAVTKTGALSNHTGAATRNLSLKRSYAGSI